ncbi:MAG: DUF481 domain-containing protein [Halieaceae bacterium]
MIGKLSTAPAVAVTLILLILSPILVAEEEAAVAGPPPDRIVLKNGSTILGTITATRDGIVNVDTDFAGSLEIAQDQIQSLGTTEPAVIQLADGKVLDAQPIVVENEQVVDATSGQSFALADLAVVNPEPYELGIGYQWSGLVNFSMVMERGNADTDELDYKLETQWLSDDDRFTIRLNGEIDEANDVEIADNWSIIGKYDYFLDGPWYVGGNVAAESDDFADLDLRYYMGPYVGRNFYDTDLLFLEAELGLAYVNEDFIIAEDQEYPGANWELHFSSNYLGGDSRLYVDHVGIWNLEETSDLILNTTFGLAFPLLFSLEAAAEVLIEYDSGAVEGVEELDETYSFRIGYTW